MAKKKKERNDRTPPQCGNSPQFSGAYGWCLGTDFLFHLRGSLVTVNQRAFGQAAGTHSVPEEFLVGPAFQRDLWGSLASALRVESLRSQPYKAPEDERKCWQRTTDILSVLQCPLGLWKHFLQQILKYYSHYKQKSFEIILIRFGFFFPSWDGNREISVQRNYCSPSEVIGSTR